MLPQGYKKVLIVRHPDEIDSWWLRHYPYYKAGDKVYAAYNESEGRHYIIDVNGALNGRVAESKITRYDPHAARISRMV